jgi:non-specific serine/threonine protein kinase
VNDFRLLPDGATLDPGECPLPPSVRSAFGRGVGPGLFALATAEARDILQPGAGYWRRWAREFLFRLARRGGGGEPGGALVPLPGPEEIRGWVLDAPPVPGFDSWDEDAFRRLWRALEASVREGLGETGRDVPGWLAGLGGEWSRVGRVTFHLAENPRSESRPFAFLATVVHRFSEDVTEQHLPLGKAVRQAAEAKDAAALRPVWEPVEKAARDHPFWRGLVESGDILRPLAWTPEEAYRFLQAVPAARDAGIAVRVPDWWEGGRPPRPRVVVELQPRGEGAVVGAGQVLAFRVRRALGDETLADEEWDRLLAAGQGLVLLRGKWVEIDPVRLEQALAHWRRVEEAAAEGRVGFFDGMRWIAGFRGGPGGDGPTGAAGEESVVEPSGDFRRWLGELRDPDTAPEIDPGPGLRARLRPYQRKGLAWMHRLQAAGLGACLADDMGLGKTLQVIALLVATRRPGHPSLVVAPASLLGNWRAELARFAPDLRVVVAHRSSLSSAGMETLERALPETDVVVTTYAMAGRWPVFASWPWDLLVLDEAQAIKNPAARQTLAVKRIPSRARIALTGTPVENGLTDLWSLFDFLNPGLLGGASWFAGAAERLRASGHRPLRKLVGPFLLRRMKTDPGVAEDLPGKIESRVDCFLTKGQAALYEVEVRHLAARLRGAAGDDRERRGAVLETLTRLKRLCDHPALLTGSGNFDAARSGKLVRLRELAAEIALRGEKVLVFTQFREMTGALAAQLEGVFRRPGLVLHGGVPVGRRAELAERFQTAGGPPFFVVSLRAGGTGLNLTAASHVVHFDRWWNPAVEDQATDRAYRIGQTRTVLVHRFRCLGTVEERIDALLEEKRDVARQIIGTDGGGLVPWEAGDEELLRWIGLAAAETP